MGELRQKSRRFTNIRTKRALGLVVVLPWRKSFLLVTVIAAMVSYEKISELKGLAYEWEYLSQPLAVCLFELLDFV
jgi:hypothetical protein